MSRTTEAAVMGILLKNYDTKAAPSLLPFIDGASSMVDDVQAYATDMAQPLSDTKLELIERWLAAHFYMCGPDKGYASKSTGGASGSYEGATAMGLDATYYGQMAMRLDPSGGLTALNKRQSASMTWAGKPASQQIPYDQRS